MEIGSGDGWHSIDNCGDSMGGRLTLLASYNNTLTWSPRL